MCYICEMEGTVGPNYKQAQKAINEALRVWKRKGQRDDGDRYQIGTPKTSWGWRHDWTKKPANRVW